MKITRKLCAGILLYTLFFQWIPLQIHETVFSAPDVDPVVNTTIGVAKTGSEPFDAASWNGTNLATAGFDADEDNNVVRIQDTVTYQVELSVNDADVDSLSADITLDKKQEWIAIPDTCRTIGVSPISSISADRRTLFCNTGPALEGTAKVIYPTARVLPISYDSTEITLNDDRVSASVVARADGSIDTTPAISQDIVVTANFEIDTTKWMKALPKDNNGDGIAEDNYIVEEAPGPNGEDGRLVEFRIRSEYQKGSMLMDSDESSFEVDIDLLDVYSDDNNNNNLGGLSSGVRLYTWGPDGAAGACSLAGPTGGQGTNASVSCTQGNIVIDQTGPTNNPDGINDRNVNINLRNIDVRDPNRDGFLFDTVVRLWVNVDQDMRTSQTCVGNACTLSIINEIGTYNSTSPILQGFNPVSTEDAGGNNLLNYNGVGEPLNNEKEYRFDISLPGYWVPQVSFKDHQHALKPNEQYVSRGQVIPLGTLHVYSNGAVETGRQSQVCTNIDTTQFEYLGIPSTPSTKLGSIWTRNVHSIHINKLYGQQEEYVEGYQAITYEANPADFAYLYANTSMPSLTALRDTVCEDDRNGDGVVNIQRLNGTQTNPGNPVDWWQDWTQVPGEVSQVRQEWTIGDTSQFDAQDWAYRMYFFSQHELRVKETATGYGSKSYISLFQNARPQQQNGVYEAWRDFSGLSVDPENIGFSFSHWYADRNILVDSFQEISKGTLPAGIKVVKAGDEVDFVLRPFLTGVWPTSSNTVTITDDLPVGSSYVPGSEQFSVDEGTTWMTRSEYNASTPDMTLTSSEPASSDTTLTWNFGDVEPVEKFPQIRYTVRIADDAPKGELVNTATIDSPMGIDKDGDGNPDPVSATYSLSIPEEYGLELLKTSDKKVYSINTPFTFDLRYQSLGLGNYAQGEFIDIFPYNGDGDTENSSGLASSRDPGTTYTGSLVLSEIIGTGNETFWVTDTDPTTIPQDPCDSANQPAGYVPSSGDMCYLSYINNGNRFSDGASQGAGTVSWSSCTGTDVNSCGIAPEDMTALRFTSGEISPAATNNGIRLEFTPLGNQSGTPDYDADGDISSASTGDIYTNNFGGRVADISLLVISNDQSVTVVSGSIGDKIWNDENEDGVQDANEPGVNAVEVQLYYETESGTYVPFPDPADLTGSTPYRIITGEDGMYLFENLPEGNYEVRVNPDSLPIDTIQTYDQDDGALPASFSTPHTSQYILEERSDTSGNVVGLSNTTNQDFGYFAPLPEWLFEKDTTSTPMKAGDTLEYQFTLTNTGNVDISSVVVSDPKCTSGPNLNFSTDTNSDLILSIGETWEYSCTSIPVTQQEADDGEVINIANVTGIPSSGVLKTLTGSTIKPIGPVPRIVLEKGITNVADTNSNGIIDAGDTVSYRFEVQNTGNVTLYNVIVTDDSLPGIQVSGDPIASLAPNEKDSTTFTAQYVLQYSDIVRGGVENTALATGTDPNDIIVTDVSDAGTTPDRYYDMINDPATSETDNPLSVHPNDNQESGDDPTTYLLPPRGNISGTVYDDLDRNNTGEAPFPGVTLQVYLDVDSDGNPDSDIPLQEIQTDANGNYVFPYLPYGSYVIREIQPQGYENISQNEGGDDNDQTSSQVEINTLTAVVDASDNGVDSGNNFVERKNIGRSIGGGSTPQTPTSDSETISEPEVELEAAPEVEPTPEPKPIPEPTLPEIPTSELEAIVKKYKTNVVIGQNIPLNEVGDSKLKQLPRELPRTGTPILERTKVKRESGVMTEILDTNAFRLAGTTHKDIRVWKQVLPEEDRDAQKYIVLPSNGLVMPVNEFAENTKSYRDMINGREGNINPALRNGALEYPGTSTRGYGELGNKVIFGHSSYWYNKAGRYKTQFQKIIELDEGEEIWIYEKNSTGKYEQYRYKTTKSYNTDPSDTGVLLPGVGKGITLITCTPVGGISGRWVVRGQLIENTPQVYKQQAYFSSLSPQDKIMVKKMIWRGNPLDDVEKKAYYTELYMRTKKLLGNPVKTVDRDLHKTIEFLQFELAKKLLDM